MGIFSPILDLFFPPKCIFCGKILKQEETRGKVCRACRRTVGYNEELRRFPGVLERVCAPLDYRNGVRRAILRLKFRGRSDHAVPLGTFIADEVARRFRGEYDVVTWVPISSKRYKRRRYDQAMLLAEAAALQLGSVAVSTLEKVRDTVPNSRLDASKRAANVRGAYVVTAPELVAGKRVLIIDDVVTTGSTICECARMLRKAGAAEVIGAAVASSKAGDDR